MTPPRPDPVHPPQPDPAHRRPKRTRKQRAKAVRDAVTAKGPGPYSYRTPDGHVLMTNVQVVTEPNGEDVVEVNVANPENGDPSFRVINPPRYVPDPDGDIIINGHPFTEDPLAALAHVVAQHGGRFKDPRRGLA